MDPRQESEKVEAVKKFKRKPFFAKMSFWLFVALLVVGYMYYQKTKEMAVMQNPMAQAGFTEEELEKVTNEMKSHVVASSGDEIKILGIIDNPDQLRKEQLFYKDVQKGDYVFVFTGTSRALIWRPESKQVVNFGVFEVKNEQVEPAPTPAPAKTEKSTKAE